MQDIPVWYMKKGARVQVFPWSALHLDPPNPCDESMTRLALRPRKRCGSCGCHGFICYQDSTPFGCWDYITHLYVMPFGFCNSCGCKYPAIPPLVFPEAYRDRCEGLAFSFDASFGRRDASEYDAQIWKDDTLLSWGILKINGAPKWD